MERRTRSASRTTSSYGTPEEGAEELSNYSDEQLEFLIEFLRGSVAYQEERMRRLEELKAREADAAPDDALG
jgi:hypothetical protein